MRLEVVADRAKLAIDSMGDLEKKKQNLTYTRLINLCQRIANNSITIEEFLEKVGHNIRTRQDKNIFSFLNMLFLIFLYTYTIIHYNIIDTYHIFLTIVEYAIFFFFNIVTYIYTKYYRYLQ